MKYGKRLLAVMMSIVMILTIVPLAMFAFAINGDGEPDTPFEITDYADLKEVLEGLGSDKYPLDKNYLLLDDIDGLHDWVFASAENQAKAAEDLGFGTTTPATYRTAIADDLGVETLYTYDGETFTEYTGETPADPAGYYVVDVPASTSYEPLTEEQYAALTADQRTTLFEANGSEIPVITPANKVFTGTFDGNNKEIRSLHIQVNSMLGGLFLNVGKGAVVKDFSIDATSIIGFVSVDNAWAVEVGSVAGQNAGLIDNVTSSATVSILVKLPVLLNQIYVGGIAGSNGKTADGSEITNCTFNGTINFDVAAASFDDASNLASVDSSAISIGGIAGVSESPVTGTFTGTVNQNFVGGLNQAVNKMYVGDETESNNLTETLQATDKEVGSKDAETYFGSTGTITVEEPNDDGYQLVKQTLDGKDKYYIRQVVCAHASATFNAETPATCDADGFKDHWYCADCEKYFIDDPRNDVTAEEANYNNDIKIAKTGHSYGAWEQEENNNTQHKRVCANDPSHIEYQNHKFNNVVTPATTEAQGYTTHTCTICGYSYVDSYTPVLAPSVEPKSGSGYSKDSTGKILITAFPDTKDGITVAQLKNSLVAGNYTVRNASGTIINSGTIRTGYTVEVTGNPESKVTIAVKGDVNKDGKVGISDYMAIRKHIMETDIITKNTIEWYAADTDSNSKVGISDYMAIRKLIMK